MNIIENIAITVLIVGPLMGLDMILTHIYEARYKKKCCELEKLKRKEQESS